MKDAKLANAKPPAGAAKLQIAPRACPVCRKPATDTHAPFCCKRCADVDLAKWLGGRYAIPTPGEEPPEPDESDRG